MARTVRIQRNIKIDVNGTYCKNTAQY